jgi:hypothetical protein
MVPKSLLFLNKTAKKNFSVPTKSIEGKVLGGWKNS